MYANSGTKPSSDYTSIIIGRPSEYYSSQGNNIVLAQEANLLGGYGEEATNEVQHPTNASTKTEQLQDTEMADAISSQEDPEKVQSIINKIKHERELASAGPLVVAKASKQEQQLEEEEGINLSGKGKRRATSILKQESSTKKNKLCHTFKFN
jgi:hypothetical protein